MSARTFETVGDLAAATIDVLDERGWCQGTAEDTDGTVCVGGAVNVAAYGKALPNEFYNPATLTLGLALGLTDGSCGTGLPGWNDDDGRTVEDVKLALKHAAESTEPCPDLTIEASR